MEETIELGKRGGKTSKEIYAFLNKHAARTDEQKVVAEYRQKFDARVFNFGLDVVTGGGATTEHLKHAMKPPASLDDIQWIARILGTFGETFSAQRLAKYHALAMGELTKDSLPHKSSCPPQPRVEAFVTEKADGTEVETTHCLECGAAKDRIMIPPEIVPFLDAFRAPDSDMSDMMAIDALEQWMDRESIPESERPQLRQRTEAFLKAIQEDAP